MTSPMLHRRLGTERAGFHASSGLPPGPDTGRLLVPAGPPGLVEFPVSRHTLPELEAGEGLRAVAGQTPGHFRSRQETGA